MVRRVRCAASVKPVEAAPMRGDDDASRADCGVADREARCRDGARADMAKAKCVHPDRPVAKACGDCPRRK
jgi:hypothetical protein